MNMVVENSGVLRLGNMHIYEENVYIEIVNKKGDILDYNQSGEIVVTGINLYAMPFIRYRLGDSGSVEISNCKYGNSAKILISFMLFFPQNMKPTAI